MQTINVVANPYFFITADGVPQGVVSKPGMTDAWIGAVLDDAACFKADKFRFWFTGAVVTVLFTAAIARAVQEGDLFVADTESALLCGISDEDFLTADECLKASEAKAAEQWKANTGRDMKPAPSAPTKTDAQIAAEKAAAVAEAKAKADAAASAKPATGGSLWTTPAVDPKADLGVAPTTSK